MRFKLRADVEIVRIDPRRYLLFDRARNEHFELGPDERQIVALLDGRRDLEAIRQELAARHGRELPPRELEAFIEQLRLAGLLHDATSDSTLLTPGEATPGRLAADPLPFSAGDSRRLVNHGFDLLALVFGFVLHPLWLVPLAGLTLAAVVLLVRRFDAIFAEWNEVRAQFFLPVMLLVWVGVSIFCLGLPTALAKGMACRALGGRVRRFGIRWYRGMIPYFECDLGESPLRMTEGGIWTLLGLGIVVRLAAVSGAVLGWSLFQRGGVPHAFCLILLGPAIFGLLLRLNVLVALDGYALLCYWLDVPRLFERATAETRAWLVGRVAPEALPPRTRRWFRIYGLAAYLWQAVVLVFIVGVGGWLLTSRLGGWGAVMAITLLAWWYHESIGRWCMSWDGFRWLVRGGGPWYVRWPVRLALLAIVVAIGFIPYHHEIGGNVRLVPATEVGIRAQTAGEITENQLRQGQRVEAGDVVVRLSGRTQRANLDATAAELDAAQAQLDLLLAGTRPEEIEMARSRKQMAERRLDYTQSELTRLEGLAATNTISGADLENAQFDRDQAQEMVASATEELAKLTSGARQEEIRAAEAEVARLKVLLAHHQEELALTEIRAPISGQVVTANVEGRLGHYVQPGDLIAVVQDASRLQAEVAASEDAAVFIEPGQQVKVRLWGTDGDLITGTVRTIAPAAADTGELGVERYRTDREILGHLHLHHDPRHFVRVYVELDPTSVNLLPDMTGYGRIVVKEDNLWRALSRPVVRFVRVEVWSWLP